MSTDLVYDVLRRHEPDHILLQAAREDAATGLLDIRRLAEIALACFGPESSIRRSNGHRPFPCRCCSKSGANRCRAKAADALLEEAAEDLVHEAMGDVFDGFGPGPA